MKTKVAFLSLVVVALLAAPAVFAQASAANYTFSTTTTGSLTDMSSGTTQLIAANQDDTASGVTTMPFDFFFMGVRQTQFSVNSNGSLRFGSTPASTTGYDPLGQASQFLITAYGADQRTHLTGKVHFKVTGSAPNRVMVVEWLNMQSDFNAGGTVDLTYQVRLYEGTGVIEFVYGSMTMGAAGAADTNSNSPQIGFSSSNAANTVGTVTAAQSGSPAPTYASAAAPVNNSYVAGAITVLTSAADGSRRTFSLTPQAVNPPGGPLTFTNVAAATTTLNWTDSSNELGYVIYNSTDGVNFTLIGTAAQNATSFVASGLTASTNYTWRVTAFSDGATASLSGSQATSSATPNGTVGAGGLWSSPATWSSGAVPTINENVTIGAGATVTLDTTANAYSLVIANGGTLQFEQTTARTLLVNTDVTIISGGTFQSNPAGTQTGHVLTLNGNLVNNGTLDFSTNADTAGASITFAGLGNVTLQGTGATTDIRQINVSKGVDPTTILEVKPTNFTVRGVTTDTIVGGWLVQTSGTIKMSGTFTGASRVFSAAAYTIPTAAGFWLNNPNYTVAAQANSMTNNGLLRITQGAYNIGTSGIHAVGGGSGAQFIIEGGTLNLAGRFSPASAIVYTQSAGTVNVATVGNTGTGTTQASFGIQSTGTFNFSGGAINLVQACTGATPVDWFVPVTPVSAAGTLQAGTSATVTNLNFRIRGNIPNLVVDNTTTNKTVTPTAQVNLLGTVLIKSGSSFVTNGQICLILGPTFTNNGTVNGTSANTRFYFLGNGVATTLNGSGTFTAPLTAFEVDNPLGVTLDPAISNIIVSRVNNFSGGITNANKLTLGNGGATSAVVQLGVTGATSPVLGFDVAPVWNPGTGGVNLFYAPEIGPRTTGFEVPPSRTLNAIGFTNPNTITIAGGDINVVGALVSPNPAFSLAGGRIVTGANTLAFTSTTGIYSRTTGYVDGNFKRIFTAIGSTVFDVGTANGYTPVTFNVTAGASFPTNITVAAVQSSAPSIGTASKAINRYWKFDATGVTADITVNYLDPTDIPGTVTEANLHFLRHRNLNPSDYTDEGGTVNTAANTATLTGVSTFSDWTLAEAGADLGITKTDGVTSATPGGSVTYTITASNNGTVANPSATVADTFPAGLTCSTTCASAGGASCTTGPFGGNINDTANLPAGGTATYTANCTISNALTGTLSNTATISGGAVTDFSSANNSATDSDSLAASADLAITKTDGVTTATAGGSVTYTITASNAGPSAASGVTVGDTFPAVLTCNTTCLGSGGGTCTAGPFPGNINDTVNLPAGGSVTYTSSCTISPSATGTLSNTATVTAPGGITDPTPGNNSATDSDSLGTSADLSITKTDGVTTATPGGSVTYTITASNAGPSNAPGATVADSFPASLTCSTTCIGAGGGTCTAGPFGGNINDTVNLPAGGSVTYTSSCTVSSLATGTLSNTATVAAPGGVTDPTPGNNSATDSDTLSASADLSITKTDGVTTATPGGSVTYTITASNAGPSNATGATVADSFPASLTCSTTCIGAGGGTCTAGPFGGNINDTVNLPNGGSVTYTSSCTVSSLATGTLSNTATVTAPGGVTDPTPGNNSATDSDTITPTADLSITKTDGVTSATAGGSVTYTITASNAGPSSVSNATVADTFPASLTCTTTCLGAGGGSCTAGPFGGNINDTVNLPSGASVTYTSSCTISGAATGSLTNTATVTAPGGTTDPNPANNSATDIDALGASADLSITKTDGVTSVTPGGSATYTITASNAGPSNAPGSTVADTFPAALTCTWTCIGAGGGVCTASGSGNINDTANLPTGGSVTYTASCTVSSLASGTLSNTATVTAPGSVTDTNPGNNSATDTDTVTPLGANVSGTKTAAGSFTVGGNIVYTVVLTNSGGGAQNDNPGNEFTDVLPATVALTSASASSGTAVATVGTNTVTWNGSIPAGGSVTITINATVLPTAAGTTVSNQGTISYDSDGNNTNDATRQTDNPAVGGASDPTTFPVAAAPAAVVPTLSPLALLLMAMTLAAVAFVAMRSRIG
ncbi:MAG: DUF11 domain-containing protein [Acidobacteria bacterium]|nr:DUF11 domain-containing protein [Acidobacteriota bacterium]